MAMRSAITAMGQLGAAVGVAQTEIIRNLTKPLKNKKN